MIIHKRFLSLLLVAVMICMVCSPATAFASPEGTDGVHPRIFANADSFEKSKKLANGAYSDIYGSLVSYTDEILALGESYYDYETNLTSSYEDNWMRTIASDIEKICFLYKVTGDDKYLNAAREMTSAVISYPSWGRNSSDGNFENKGLACSHMLIALSCAYDWLYDKWTDDEKALFLTTLAERGIMLQNDPWWKSTYLSNHLWIGCTAVLVTASAIYDEYDAVSTDAKSLIDGYESIDAWFDFANSKMQRAFSLFPDDGSLHEGIMYYLYGMGFLQEYVMTAEKFSGFDASQYPFWQNTAGFLMNSIFEEDVTEDGIPAFNFGDSTVNVSNAAATHLFYLADKYGDQRAYKSAQTLIDKIPDELLYANWKLILYGIEPASESAWSVFEDDAVYSDTGYAFSHTSGGAGNSGATLGIKCGPPGGVKNINSTYNQGLSHVHPDNNSFNIFAGSKRLFADDGYTTETTSAAHNTLSVNGKGQYGEVTDSTAATWPLEAVKGNPAISAYQSDSDYFYAVGDASESYPAELGVEKFVRHFVFLKPDILVLIDDVSTKDANGDLKQLNFHPAFKTLAEADDKTAIFSDGSTVLKLQSLTDNNLETVQKSNSYDVVVTSDKQSFRQITAISWGAGAEHLLPVYASADGDVVHISAGTAGNGIAGKSISINTASCTASDYTESQLPASVHWDKSKNAISINGASSPGEYITCKAFSTDEMLMYLDQTTADSSGSYSFSFAPPNSGFGIYGVSIFDSSNKALMNIEVPAYAGESRYAISGFSLELNRGSICGTLSAEATDTDSDIMLILAEYDDSDKLEKSSMCRLSRTAGERVEAQVTLKTDDSSGKYYRLFAWDGVLKPIAFING